MHIAHTPKTKILASQIFRCFFFCLNDLLFCRRETSVARLEQSDFRTTLQKRVSRLEIPVGTAKHRSRSSGQKNPKENKKPTEVSNIERSSVEAAASRARREIEAHVWEIGERDGQRKKNVRKSGNQQTSNHCLHPSDVGSRRKSASSLRNRRAYFRRGFSAAGFLPVAQRAFSEARSEASPGKRKEKKKEDDRSPAAK